MTSLFTTQPAAAGYRLHRYEVLNWGTFDENIWSIEPAGQNSLLTGANASGKTTLVDGLLTLLVPERRMRFYNQTAGAKGERNEDSYILGEYGETENTETNTREVKRLRPKKEEARSVLLAIFRNEDKWVTVAQLRWFAGSELRRAFVFSHKKLGIAEDFLPFSPSDDWKKRIRQRYGKAGTKELVQFFDGPKEYAAALRAEFGMRSEKAHTLFSQTIGLKVLGNLDEFVRGQMLEEGDGEAEFQKLRAHFGKLRDAHRAIEKAGEQIRLLTPVRVASETLTTHKLELHTNENHQAALPLWFARRESALLELHIAEKEDELSTLTEHIGTLSNQRATLSEEERALDVQIRQDKTGQAISELREKNRQLKVQQDEREAEMRRYNAVAAQLDDMVENPDAATFGVQEKTAAARKSQVEVQLAALREQEAPAHAEANEATKNVENLKIELAALRSQKNNITGRVAEIRRELLSASGATEAEIPFVGELLRVSPNAAHWESAIEKLLHTFALQLIVPEQHYAQVNQYAHQYNLRGRIVYQRWRLGGSLGGFVPVSEKSVFHKLELRRESPYAEWLEYELKKRFDYVCTDDLTELQRCEKALTSQGLIKNTDRHEKDDRPGRTGRQYYVLGWDNKEKIAALREALDTAEATQRVAQQRLVALHKQGERIKNDSANLDKLLFFDRFKKIDWQSVVAEIQENNERITELERADNRVKTLKKQHEDLNRQLNSCEAEIKKHEAAHLKSEQDIQQKRLLLERCRETLNREEDRIPELQLSEFAAIWLPDPNPDLYQIGQLERDIKQRLNQYNSELQEAVRTTRTRLERCMNAFKNPSENITRQFEDWRSDTHRLSDDADFANEYLVLLERIEGQELAEHRQRFKTYLNEEMITRMSDFKAWLDKQKDGIKENIERLNAALANINFKSNPQTFICLQADDDNAPRVRDFQSRLRGWQPNVAEFERTQDLQILETSYLKIQSLLEDLTKDERLRREVLDVRNWLKFKAVERYRTDPTQVFRSYTGTASLSGGEGAQLTYTILSSAIAHQFGIHSEGMNTRSFRFICVDEAFSKQDDEKARFLMDLCAQLHLQIMVVSPAKAEEVAIVEPYISSVHFVLRKDNRNSVVHQMTVRQMQEQRAALIEEALST
ncbi:MAG: hypothetical protein IT260_13700 [Saprospiraceae bacterium]|nr:hypothetical protein [Saprospiraceae bacterium]